MGDNFSGRPMHHPHPGAPVNWKDVNDARGRMQVATFGALAEQPVQGKVACFDIDETILSKETKIKGRKGRVNNVPASSVRSVFKFGTETQHRLHALHSKGYRIIFMSNQKGVSLGKITLPDLHANMERLISSLALPSLTILIATHDDLYRKPYRGMWEYIGWDFPPEGVRTTMAGALNLGEVFFVGDAAGRPLIRESVRVYPKDFACSDRAFAFNAGIRFYTPEEFFLDSHSSTFDWRAWDPRWLLSGIGEKNTNLYEIPFTLHLEFKRRFDTYVPNVLKSVDAAPNILIVLVGSPRCGKTSFARKVASLAGLEFVEASSHDTLPSSGKVILDGYFPTVESRAEVIQCGLEAGFHVHIWCFDVPQEVCLHLNQMSRQVGIAPLSKTAFYTHSKCYEIPGNREHVQHIQFIPFLPTFSCYVDFINFFSIYT